MKRNSTSKRIFFSLTAFSALVCLIAGGCLVVKHDHGLHKGQYKQMEKGKGRK